MVTAGSQRVIAYIDGFNLYYGLKDSGFRRFYWLNIQKLAQSLLRATQSLVRTKYFTTRISGGKPDDPSPLIRMREQKRQRQAVYLEALGTLADFQIYYGHYLAKSVMCRSCGRSWPDHDEKMTDVNIATEILTDAFTNRYDTALLVSADSDLVPPIRTIRRLYPEKRIILAFPPQRFSKALADASHGYRYIEKSVLKKCQFPDCLSKSDGYVLKRPEKWH